MGWLFTPASDVASVVLVATIVVINLACITGLCILLIAWRGRPAGIVLGGLVVASGLLGWFALYTTLPRYWWISLPPIYLGIQSIRTWQRPPTRGMRIGLSSLLLLTAFVAMLLVGVGQRYRARAIQGPILQRLQTLSANCQVMQDFDGEIAGLLLFEDTQEGELAEILNLLLQSPYVRHLQLRGRVTVEHGKQIGKLRNLKTLGLQYVDLDDEMLDEVGRLPNLQTLDLMETNASDDGLKYLKKAKRLRRLWLDDENFSPQALDRLRKELPGCEI